MTVWLRLAVAACFCAAYFPALVEAKGASASLQQHLIEKYQRQLLVLIIARLEIAEINYDNLDDKSLKEINDRIEVAAAELAADDPVSEEALTSKADVLKAEMEDINFSYNSPTVSPFLTTTTSTATSRSIDRFWFYWNLLTAQVFPKLEKSGVAYGNSMPELKNFIGTALNQSALRITSIPVPASQQEIDAEVTYIVNSVLNYVKSKKEATTPNLLNSTQSSGIQPNLSVAAVSEELGEGVTTSSYPKISTLSTEGSSLTSQSPERIVESSSVDVNILQTTTPSSAVSVVASSCFIVIPSFSILAEKSHW